MIQVLEKGTICHYPERFFGYYGWPSVARMEDGTLIVAASGERMNHLGFIGRTTLFFSKNDGKTWLGPVIVNDTPLDDRDAGLIPLGNNKLLLIWFNLETRLLDRYSKTTSEKESAFFHAETMDYTAELDEKYAGSLCRLSTDGGITWGETHRIPVTAPHGGILLSDGRIMMVGKEYGSKEGDGKINCVVSRDDGATWQTIATLPIPDDTKWSNYHEPHLVELKDGTLIAHIRYQHAPDAKTHLPFTIFQSESYDGGNTWTLAHDLGCCGSPPHLLLHSSGKLVCVYGRREEPFGESCMISCDNGKTWTMDIPFDTNEPSADLGYPASVEMPDGSIFTVYYSKKNNAEENCGLFFTRWKLDD